MKKAIIGLSGLVVLAFVVILFTNAQTSTKAKDKPGTEISKDCANCPSAATCTEAKTAEDAACDMTKCEGKCDPAKCATCKDKKCEVKTTEAAGCAGCPSKAVIK